jgi:hypothetical protein
VKTSVHEPVPLARAAIASGSKIEPLNRSAYAALTTSQLAVIASAGRAVK